jgi:hypothetical protein
MKTLTMSLKLNNQNKYHVSKHYHKHVGGPFDYLIKILGIDCEIKEARKKRRARSESYFRAPNEKFIEYLTILICEYKQRVKKAKLKQLHYEEA